MCFRGGESVLGEVLVEEPRCSWRLRQSEAHFVLFRGFIPQLLFDTVVLFMVLLLVLVVIVIFCFFSFFCYNYPKCFFVFFLLLCVVAVH